MIDPEKRERGVSFNRREIKSRSDAYDYITTGSQVFHIVDAVALLLLENQIRKSLQTRREKAGEPYRMSTAQEIDEFTKLGISVADLDDFQLQAFKALEEYVGRTFNTYSNQKIIDPLISEYLRPILKGRSLWGLPIGVWQGMAGNLLTIVVVLAAYGIVFAYKQYNHIDLVNIVLRFLGAT